VSSEHPEPLDPTPALPIYSLFTARYSLLQDEHPTSSWWCA